MSAVLTDVLETMKARAEMWRLDADHHAKRSDVDMLRDIAYCRGRWNEARACIAVMEEALSNG